MSKYVLKCISCSSELDERILGCRNDDALLRTFYNEKKLVTSKYPGIWKYLEWLPVEGIIEGFGGGSITYQSQDLAKDLELKNLYISFNGHWPEKNANLSTCSFKDLEAAPTIQRLTEQKDRNILVVASAGNTARAFAHISSMTGYPLVLVVPSTSLGRLWLPPEDENNSSIFVISVMGDYSDAITLGDMLAHLPGFTPEGGARNVARRDGMGTVMLEATQRMGEIPSHYFQAIGSGTGGIAAWEASMRLIEDGRFGNIPPKLNLAQNLPCAPVYYKVNGGSYDPSCPHGMVDEVLFNRRPPFIIPGGVADALRATNGQVLGVTNKEAESARKWFESTEGIDIMPAASVAVAALISSAEKHMVGPDQKVLLNITGGGVERFRRDNKTRMLRVDATISEKEFDIDGLAKRIIGKLREDC
jgi:cysteate synthase